MGFALRGDTMTDSILIDVKQVAAMVGMAERTIWRLMNCGKLPMAMKIGGSRRWRKTDVLQWIDEGCKPMQQVRR